MSLLTACLEEAGHAAEYAISVEQVLDQGHVVVGEPRTTTPPTLAALDLSRTFRQTAEMLPGTEASVSEHFHTLADLAAMGPKDELE